MAANEDLATTCGGDGDGHSDTSQHGVCGSHLTSIRSRNFPVIFTTRTRNSDLTASARTHVNPIISSINTTPVDTRVYTANQL
ncbi:hypothetical protein K440DRAFT_631407 [Wilcoxina mikolae CBS 423.85]|nr:hypothetical protein K440DRAFT_631407 [Wilcoxina mikolae CBS 423.85]